MFSMKMKSILSIDFGLVFCIMLLDASFSFENAPNNTNITGIPSSMKRSYMDIFNNLSTVANQQNISLTTESHIVNNTNRSEEIESPSPSKFFGFVYDFMEVNCQVLCKKKRLSTLYIMFIGRSGSNSSVSYT